MRRINSLESAERDELFQRLSHHPDNQPMKKLFMDSRKLIRLGEKARTIAARRHRRSETVREYELQKERVKRLRDQQAHIQEELRLQEELAQEKLAARRSELTLRNRGNRMKRDRIATAQAYESELKKHNKPIS